MIQIGGIKSGMKTPTILLVNESGQGINMVLNTTSKAPKMVTQDGICIEMKD